MPPLPEFKTFASITAHLDSLGFFHWDLTLTRIRRVLARLAQLLALPHGCGPLTAHIVGTNGKGSTAAFLAALGQAHGLRTGLYTSPHFISVRERIVVDGLPLSASEWVACANLVRQAGGEDLTYFEFITAVAAAAFARAGVELLVLEAGLGGRHDATTALPAEVVLFTPISLDHETVLGPGLPEIAADKADALATGRGIRAAISAEQEPGALAALQSAAERLDCPLFESAALIPYPDQAQLGLSGPHQCGNAHLALASWQWLANNFGLKNTSAQCLAGLREAFIPGRLQFIPAGPVIPTDPAAGLPALILDGAHNGHGLRALDNALRQMGITPSAIIFSALADKDMSAAREILTGLSAGPIFVPPVRDNPRAAAPAVLAEMLGRRASPVPDLETALHQAASNQAATSAPVLVCGSLYLLGEFYTLHPKYLTSASPAVHKD